MTENNSKKTLFTGKKAAALIGVLVFAAGVLAAFLFLRFEFYFEPENHLAIYFFNPSEGQLSPEWRVRPDHADTTSIIDALFVYMQEAPRQSGHTRIWPDTGGEDLITALFLDEEMLVVMLTDAYLAIPPLDEAIFRSALTLTLISLPEVESVKLVLPSVDGAEERELLETAVTIANNPAISPARIAADEFTLFFLHESGEGLLIEEYVASEVDRLRREVYIMERLIAGPTLPEMISFIPPETQVRSAFAHADAGAIYVDLSADFVTRFNGTTAQARMTLAAITNTLIENTTSPGIRRVIFLINSERREEFHGVGDFGAGFTFDADLLIDDVMGDRLFLDIWDSQE